MKIMMEAFPDRAFDVGIAEQHAVTLAAGMATQGLVPFCNIYSTFLQRAYDQVIHDVALQKLPVIFCLDRAGLVGQDGATHHGNFDLAFLNCIPDIIIAAPMDAVELRNIMYAAQLGLELPIAIRYPRGRGTLTDWKQPFEKIALGKARMLHQGKRIAVLSIGTIGVMVQELIAREHLDITHIDVRFLKPLDEAAVLEVLNTHEHVITIEDGTIVGGLGSVVGDLAFAKATKPLPQIYKSGIPDSFIEQGPTEDLQRIAGFDSEALLKLIKSL
jgi:1-deoxy-D-xylulose-5-phosphate synthase